MPGDLPYDPDAIDDDVLRLVFVSCHPVLSREARVALTLRVVGGLSTEEIARAFLVPVSTVQQRIVRAKKTLGDAGVPFEVPPRSEFPERLGTVLGVLYLIFNEGYSARPARDLDAAGCLSREALRLARVLAGLVPREPEAHGLVALMELTRRAFRARSTRTATRCCSPTRTGAAGTARRSRAGGRRSRAPTRSAAGAGAYALQAAIAEQHDVAASVDDTDWATIVALYEALGQVAPSPVVELNRAVAVAMADGARGRARDRRRARGRRAARALPPAPGGARRTARAARASG